ncbi:MAG: penicillin-binding protein 1A [Alphaproteobacteria bacterium]|nr:penicillin-binding protein 1A [Alphaproteobacteria bacterium]
MLRTIFNLLVIAAFVAFLGFAVALGIFFYFGRGLPDYQQLADYEPPTVTRFYAGDGRLLAEYAVEKRVFVPVEAIPKRVIKAVLAAEDKNFYDHPGVDVLSVVRALVDNLSHLGQNRRPQGASTITQQVAKNFLLTNELSLDRKIKEAILAFRIEHAFSKDRILELYLNEIYLGFGSYGVAAAALNYYDKSLDELSIEEAAYLAALPKAPNNYHPINKPEAAKARRNWVIERMASQDFISDSAAKAAKAAPLVVARKRGTADIAKADYFVEEVRRELLERYGEDALYHGGLSVRTTLDPKLQATAERTLRAGLIHYDRRHGWRGPIARIDPGPAWPQLLAALPKPKGLGEWRLAMVLNLDADAAWIGFADGGLGKIPLAKMQWARPWLEGEYLGPKVEKPADVVEVGDVVAVEADRNPVDGVTPPPGTYGLRQIPEIEGGLVAMDPHTGRVLAMTGGFDFEKSEFNRATQALRQPGSAFKPFVYLAALNAGFTPSSLILDAPFVIDQGPGLGKWKPMNYGEKFYGPSTMRLGIEKSRNLMTVRLAQTIGMGTVVKVAKRFDIVDDMPPILSMALGAGETTLLRLTNAYGMLVNGGKRLDPSFIDRIQDRHGKTIFRQDPRNCEACAVTHWLDEEETPEEETNGVPSISEVPELPALSEGIADQGSVYQVVSMLEGVIERGTGQIVRSIRKPLAGKTGTTNESLDAWFIGFSPDLVVGVFVGFDVPRSLGPRETGSRAAAPIFRDIMAETLKRKPAVPFRIPPGIQLVRVNAQTGLPARPGDRRVILEAFKPGTEPKERGPVLDGSTGVGEPTVPTDGTGGLY